MPTKQEFEKHKNSHDCLVLCLLQDEEHAGEEIQQMAHAEGYYEGPAVAAVNCCHDEFFDVWAQGLRRFRRGDECCFQTVVSQSGVSKHN